MDRRDFVKTGLASAATLGAAGVEAAPAQQQGRRWYELRTYELRNDIEPARIQSYFETAYLPALRRQGVGPVGVFTPEFGMPSPALVVLLEFPSAEAFATLAGRLAADAAFRGAWREFESGKGQPYVRYDSVLLHAFPSHPRVETLPDDAARPPRLLELRTYEAPNAFGLGSKVEMFDREEIAIFRKVGFSPVFFGEAVAGARLPHLTYMIAFPDMAARMKAWDAFRADPDWARIRNLPGWANPETVSAQRVSFLRPTAFSQIR